MPHWKKRETFFAEYGIELTLPGAWQLRPSDDPIRWFYRSADHKEYLTISRRDMEGARKESEEAALMQRAVARHRRAVELGFGRVPNLTMSEVEYGERLGVPAGSYMGGAGDEHQFWSVLLFPKGTVWGFFYEAFRFAQDDAEERARVIFEAIAFRK